MITRKQYMADSSNLHDAYYRQFVTPEIKQRVLNRIGLERLKSARFDFHLNSIPLGMWDNLAGGYGCQLGREKMKELGDGPSLGGGVCILKAAARMIIEENS